MRFHTSQEIIDLIKATGVNAVFLPPYSPDVSPIEKIWSKIKEILNRKKPRTQAAFHDSILIAASSINTNGVEEWYEACGYQLT